MNEINDVSTSQLTHTELAETANNYLTILQNHLSGNAFLMSLVALMLPVLQNLRGALSAIRTNELVKKAFELDQARDSAFVFFRDLVAAFSKSDLPEEKEAHDKLWPIFEKVGTRLYDEGYLEQSGKLEVLFQEMDKPVNLAYIEVLGVTSRYNKLKGFEGAFKEVYSERLEEDVKMNYPTIKEARRALAPLVADLTPTLRNIARTAEEGTDLTWIGLINEQTSRVMTQVAARRTRKNNAETTE